MGEIFLDLDFTPLRAYVDNLRKELEQLSEKDLTFEIVNIAKDEGKETSTGLYYYKFVDEGRDKIVQGPDDKKLRFKSSKTGKWIAKKSVKKARPRRITKTIKPKLQKENNKQAKELLTKTQVPRAAAIKTMIQSLKEKSLEICESVVLDILPEESHDTRANLYGVDDSAPLYKGFRIKGEEDK